MTQPTNPAELPPGFRVLNDGPGREVLLDDRTDDPAPTFATRAEAVETAWRHHREIYEPEASPAPAIREFPVYEWTRPFTLSDPHGPEPARPVMPEGSREEVGGVWVLPTGERVRPVVGR